MAQRNLTTVLRNITASFLCGAVCATAVLSKTSVTDNSKVVAATGKHQCVESPPTAPNTVAKEVQLRTDEPQLTILRPKEGETFNDTPIFVQVRLENFELLPPEPNFGAPDPRPVGHLHVFLDDYPEVATSSTELMFGKKEAGHYLKKGVHTIAVEVVHDNHDTLEPRVWKRVNFNVTH